MDKPIKILLVEDNEDDAILLERKLVKDNIDVTIIRVESAKDFELALQTGQWHLVISDYNLPGFSGTEALEIFKNKHIDIPFILISGQVGEELAIQMMHSGAHDYILKNNLSRLGPAIIREIAEAEMRRERKNAIVELEKSEAKLRSVFENIPAIVAIINVNGEISYMNQPLGNFELTDFINHKYTVFLTEYDAKKAEKAFAESLKKSAPVVFESSYLLSNGTIIYFENKIAPVQEKNNVSSLILIMNDITTRKQFEKELAEKYAQIQDINNQLVVSKTKAEESDKLKSAFLANMSHEIRTPMNAICGFAALLRGEEITSLKREKYIDIINSNSNQLLNIINDILDISKIEVGLLSIKKSAFNLKNFLTEIETEFQSIAEQKKLTFETFYESGVDNMVVSDESKLRQILVNLLSNAIKFTSNGFVKLSCSIEDGLLIFKVADSGIGIPDEYKQVVFERFRQVEIGQTRKYGGTGLGLSISKALAKLFEGELQLISNEDTGSCFILHIPYEPFHLPNITVPHSEKTLVDFSNFTVLVAEDEETNFLYLEEVLSNSKFKILRAINGIEAVKYISNSENKIDIILMDIKMPELSGIDATRQIKDINPQLPIIAQTAYAMQTELTQILESGFDDYLAKPIKPEKLLEKLKKHLKY